MAYKPWLSVVTLEAGPFPLSIVTVAPASPVPLWSLTVPVMAALASCAEVGGTDLSCPNNIAAKLITQTHKPGTASDHLTENYLHRERCCQLFRAKPRHRTITPVQIQLGLGELRGGSEGAISSYTQIVTLR